MRRPKQPPTVEIPAPDADAILQVKVWLLDVSRMVWRRLLVPSSYTLRELHGVIQVAMGWEGIHLYDFQLRAAHYGSWELSASSPDVTLATLRLRKGTRFVYEYDLNIPWRREVRIEDRLGLETGKTYPLCTGGGGACPPEDCGGPESFMAAVTTGSRSMLSKTWTPWWRFFSGSRQEMDRIPSRMSSMKKRAGAWKTPLSGQRRARRRRDGRFRGAR